MRVGTDTAEEARDPGRIRRLSAVLLYAVLAIVVWGLFAADRGLFQDDAAALFWVRYEARLGPLAALFFRMAPTRALANIPYGIAGYCPDPILALHLFYGAAWLGLGLLTHAIVRELFPERPRLPLVAGALVLCLNADFLTNSPIALGYHVAADAMATFVLCSLRYLRTGRWPWALGAGAALAWSLWTYEAGLPSILLAPVLFWLTLGSSWSRRLTVLVSIWGFVLVPWSLTFWRFLTDPGSYAGRAIVRTQPQDVLRLALQLFEVNFTPWQWLLARPVWFVPVERVLPFLLTVPLVLVTVLVFLWASAMRPRRQPAARPWPAGRAREAGLALWLAAATFGSNAVFAGVIASEFHYRTHIFSKIWAAVLVALVGDWLSSALGRAERAGIALPALFVALGAGAGLERQDYYLSSWRNHRAELASIVARVPGLRPDASLVLFTPSQAPAYKATEAEYLARAWLSLLEADSTLHDRVFLWSASRGAGCQAEGVGLRCWEEGQEPCFRQGKCTGKLVSIEKLVFMSFSPASGRYEWRDTLVAPALDSAAPLVGYRPSQLVLRRRLEPWIEDRLFGPWGLARFLPAFKKDDQERERREIAAPSR